MAHVPRLEFLEEFMSLSRLAIAETVRPEVDANMAEALAQRITGSFLALWGGTQVYLPRADYIERLRRDRAIAREFTGGEAEAIRLAKQYNVSTIHVYRICRAQRAQRKGPQEAPRKAPEAPPAKG